MKRLLFLCSMLALLLHQSPSNADVVHVVRQNENLARIAARYYGDEAREAVLVAANVLHAQAATSLVAGMHLVVPSVRYYRVEAGDTWTRIAQRELGSPLRAGYLAGVNNGDFELSPSPGSVIRIPYLLRYVVLTDETLADIARRFYGERAIVQFLLEFNRLSTARLTRGQVLLLPLSELTLREEPLCEASAPLAAASASQQLVAREIPSLEALVTHGQYVEAVALGARLRATEPLTTLQRTQIDRALAFAYCALDRTDLAAEAFRDALTIDRGFSLDQRSTPPKVLTALAIARGQATERNIAPAPPSSRPDTAH